MKDTTRNKMIHMTSAQHDALARHDVYRGRLPHMRGRRTAVHPTLDYVMTEGVDYLVDDDPSHLPALTPENARELAYYLVAGEAVCVHRVRRETVTRETVTVETTLGTFVVPREGAPTERPRPAFGAWTAVEDDLPDEGEPVLVACREGGGAVRTDNLACRRWGAWVWWTGNLESSEEFVEDDPDECRVTHWMPRPPAPEET